MSSHTDNPLRCVITPTGTAEVLMSPSFQSRGCVFLPCCNCEVLLCFCRFHSQKGACYFHKLLQPLSSKSKLVTSSVTFFFKVEGRTCIWNGNWAAQPYIHKQKSNNRKQRRQMCFTFIILIHESGCFDISLRNLSSTASPASLSLQRERWEQKGLRWNQCGFGKGTLEGNAA